MMILAGCTLPGGAPASRQLEGVWTGRIVQATAHDRVGRTYAIAAIQITSGPVAYSRSLGARSPYQEYAAERIGPDMGMGRLPLLVRGEGLPRVIHTADVPVGQSVRLRGLMMIYAPRAPEGAPEGAVYRAPAEVVAADDDHLLAEHLLLIRGPIEPTQKAEDGVRSQ